MLGVGWEFFLGFSPGHCEFHQHRVPAVSPEQVETESASCKPPGDQTCKAAKQHLHHVLLVVQSQRPGDSRGGDVDLPLNGSSVKEKNILFSQL